MTAQQLHQVFEALKAALAEAEANFGPDIPVQKTQSDYNYADQLRFDTRMYCWYLAASDGKLAYAETNFINQVLGENVTQENLLKMLNMTGIGTTSGRDTYEKGAVPSFGIAVCADFFYEKMGKSPVITDMLLRYFTELGIALISIDGDLSPTEKDDVLRFVDNKVKGANLLKAMLHS